MNRILNHAGRHFVFIWSALGSLAGCQPRGREGLTKIACAHWPVFAVIYGLWRSLPSELKGARDAEDD